MPFPDLTDEDIERARQAIEAEQTRAVYCRCGQRCDPSYGDGERCMVCASRPSAETMRMRIGP